jgi:non-homologous end joining protein Ku
MGNVQNARLQIGLLATDVSLQKATNERNAISFNRAHKHTPGAKDSAGNPLPAVSFTGEKVYCKDCGVEIPSGDPSLTKGYSYQKGQLIEVPEAHLTALKVPSSGAILVSEVVSPDEINCRPFMLSGSYYHLVPPSKAKHIDPAYGLILESLKDGSYAVGQTAIYGRTQTVAITAGQNCLLMYMLRYPTEVRQEPQVTIPPVDQANLAMCKQILGILRKPSINLNYADDYETAKKNLVDMLMQGITTLPQAPTAPVVANKSIEEQLKATLAALQGQAPAAETKEPEAKAPKGKAKGKKGKAA